MAANRRERIEAEDFLRRRGVAALARGDALDVEEVPRRPNAALIGGIVLVVLLAAGSAATAFITERAPDGWLDDSSLVVDEDTGARYMARGGTLLPAPTLTAALLAGARAEPVLVAHENVVETPVGLPLPGAGTPESPPTVPDTSNGFTACVTGTREIDVFSDAPAILPTGADGVLVRPLGQPDVYLVAGRRAHAVSEEALTRLGYSAAQVREVPRGWVELAPRGPDLDLLRAVPSPTGGLPGIAGGQTVASAETGRVYLVSGGTLRPLANRTTALLAPPPALMVPDAVLARAPIGEPTGILDAPSTPPVVPPREAVVIPCVRSSDGTLTVAAAFRDSGTRATPTRRVGPVGNLVTWHFPLGQGALVGPLNLDAPRPPGRAGQDDGGGIRLVAAGIGHPIADLEVLRQLGYRREQTVKLPPSWLALLEPGAVLATAG